MSDHWFSSTTQGVVVPVASRTPWLWDSGKLKFDRFGRTVGLWWSLVCWFVFFVFVGLLSYIVLCGDDNFFGIFNCIYITYIYTIVVSFYLSKLYFLPPAKKHRPNMPQLFFKTTFSHQGRCGRMWASFVGRCLRASQHCADLSSSQAEEWPQDPHSSWAPITGE